MIFDVFELNYSKINTYIFCPVLYEYIYIKRKRTPISADASLGISLHRALDIFYKSGKVLDDLICAYDANWLSMGYKDAAQQMEYYRKGKRLLEEYWLFETERKSKVIFAEQMFAFEHKQWIIKGTIDRLDKYPDGTYEIIDYKTGPEGKTEEDVKNNLQLSIYALGCERGLNIKPARVAYYVLSANKKIEADYNPLWGERALNVFEDIGKKIADAEITANTANCAKCAIKNTCPNAVFTK